MARLSWPAPPGARRPGRTARRGGQGGHAAASLMAKHEISRQLSLQAKLTGLYHPACRGAPRNAGVTLRCAF